VAGGGPEGTAAGGSDRTPIQWGDMHCKTKAQSIASRSFYQRVGGSSLLEGNATISKGKQYSGSSGRERTAWEPIKKISGAQLGH